MVLYAKCQTYIDDLNKNFTPQSSGKDALYMSYMPEQDKDFEDNRTVLKNICKCMHLYIFSNVFKLFMQELRSINILGRIRTSKSIATPRG